jgi:hypothetical protein
MRLVKEQVLDALKKLPDDATYEDILDTIGTFFTRQSSKS